MQAAWRHWRHNLSRPASASELALEFQAAITAVIPAVGVTGIRVPVADTPGRMGPASIGADTVIGMVAGGGVIGIGGTAAGAIGNLLSR